MVLRIAAFFIIALSISACGEFQHRPAPIRSAWTGPPVIGPHDEFLTSRDEPVTTRTARTLIGIPYRWGGTTPQTGFDCSGLIQYVYNHNGIHVPRTTGALFDVARPVAFSQIQPGDLVFFRVASREVSHVGIYLGEYLFIHAPSTGKSVTYASLLDNFWYQRFVGAGRIYY